MKKDLKHAINNLDDSAIIVNGDASVPLTVKHVIVESMLQASGPLTAEEKSRRWQFIKKINKSYFVNVTEDEIKLIKKAAEVQPVIIYGQICDWLDSEEEPTSEVA